VGTNKRFRPYRITGPARATAANPVALVAIAPIKGGDPVGAGLIVPAPEGETSVVTCAHVVVAAGGDGDGGQVAMRSWAAPGHATAGTVRPGGWHPVDDRGRGDVAILRPAEKWPEPVAFAELAQWSQRDRSRWQAFGYPARYKKVGQHASGRFIGRFGPDNEWVQIDAEVVTGYRIVPGYSGSPVWELQQNAVVGLAVSEDAANPAARSGGMLPVEVIARYWDPLASLIRRGTSSKVLAVDLSWLHTAQTIPEPTSLGFTVTNTSESVVKLTSIRCRVLDRKPTSYIAASAGIPPRYELTLTLHPDHDEYELLGRQHILQPRETEEYKVTIKAQDHNTRYLLALELTWRAVDTGAQGSAFLEPFYSNL
jgi:Trypsin-like peptidase domain